MSNSPNDNCKPNFDVGGNTTVTPPTPGPDKNTHRLDTESIIGLVIFILCVLYSSIRTASSSQAAKLSGSDKILLKDNGEGGNADPEANKVWDNEEVCRFLATFSV